MKSEDGEEVVDAKKLQQHLKLTILLTLKRVIFENEGERLRCNMKIQKLSKMSKEEKQKLTLKL